MDEFDKLREAWEKGLTPIVEIDAGSEMMVISKDKNEDLHATFYFRVGCEWQVSKDYTGKDGPKLVAIVNDRFSGYDSCYINFPKKG